MTRVAARSRLVRSWRIILAHARAAVARGSGGGGHRRGGRRSGAGAGARANLAAAQLLLSGALSPATHERTIIGRVVTGRRARLLDARDAVAPARGRDRRRAADRRSRNG